MIGWPAPGDTLDNCLIWITTGFCFTCWFKKLSIVSIGGMIFFYFYLLQIATWATITEFPPGGAGMFAIATFIFAILVWTLSAPAKFGFNYEAYKWLVVLWCFVSFAINAYWLYLMEQNKNALYPQIENVKQKMAYFMDPVTGGKWEVGSDCPTGFRKCATIPSGLPETDFYPYVPIAAGVPVLYLLTAFLFSFRDTAPTTAGDYVAMKP